MEMIGHASRCDTWMRWSWQVAPPDGNPGSDVGSGHGVRHEHLSGKQPAAIGQRDLVGVVCASGAVSYASNAPGR